MGGSWNDKKTGIFESFAALAASYPVGTLSFNRKRGYMFFQKNLPKWERALRLCIGLVIVIASFVMPIEPAIKWVAVAAGVVFACTGFIGFCPMCAMFGRKLKRSD